MRQLALYCHRFNIRQLLRYPVLGFVEINPHQAVADIYSGRTDYFVSVISALSAERKALHAEQHRTADERDCRKNDNNNRQSHYRYSNATAASRLFAQSFLFRSLIFLRLCFFVFHAGHPFSAFSFNLRPE